MFSRFLPRFVIVAAFATFSVASQAGVLLQGFYWDVPSPAAGNSGADWWWDHIAAQANSLRGKGFTAVWLPPMLKSAAGGYSDGYDPFDDYDIGSKNQRGTVPTRYGTREQLERVCAMLRANNIDVYADIVDNHRDGDSGNFQFNYVDAYGNPNGGRFGKSAYDFHPNVSQDPNVPAGLNENFNAFGRDVAHINGAGHWMYNQMMYSGNWLTQALDLKGYRLDDVPGISTDWLRAFLNYGSLNGKFAVGEFYDYNANNVEGWIQQMQGRTSAFDFPLRGLLKNMCNDPAHFDMSTLDHAGLTGMDPTHSVTFVENHDTDRSEPVLNNKMLAYACILTSEGYPAVFYKDYSKDPACYALQDNIDKLVWVHENLASGTTIQRYKNNLVFCYERQGGKHLLVGLNNNIGYNYILYNVQTGFGANVTLHDYTGHVADVTTNAAGQIPLLALPPAVNGMGYCALAPAGLVGTFPNVPKPTTQVYAGAKDLDVPPADNTKLNPVCRVYASGNTHINGALYLDKTGWSDKTSVYLELDDPSGKVIKVGWYTIPIAQWYGVTTTTTTTGWYTWKIRSWNTPQSNPKPNFFLTTSYGAPQTL